jgi:tRNA(fMet)-specific endonuclease VapC
MHLLDTNICIYHLKGQFPILKRRFETRSPLTLGIPAIVKAELYFGANKSQNKANTIKVLDAFLGPLAIIPFGDEEAVCYARIRAELESEGTPIGPNDLLIAATALARGAILVTRNSREFQRVKGLALEDWTI